MKVKDLLSIKIMSEYIANNMDNILAVDFNDVNYIEDKIKQSETFFENVGIAVSRYSDALLKGAGINPNEEMNQDTNLVSDLLLKTIGIKNADVES